jgi:glutamate synthase domain-containing protein 3
VVEGTGHHCCEYMTEGVVIVLGETGFNLGAGMTGGRAYVLDLNGKLNERINKGYVYTVPLLDRRAEIELKYWLDKHYIETDSEWAKEILENWEKYKPYFKVVIPFETKRRTTDPFADIDECEFLPLEKEEEKELKKELAESSSDKDLIEKEQITEEVEKETEETCKEEERIDYPEWVRRFKNFLGL